MVCYSAVFQCLYLSSPFSVFRFPCVAYVKRPTDPYARNKKPKQTGTDSLDFLSGDGHFRARQITISGPSRAGGLGLSAGGAGGLGLWPGGLVYTYAANAL